jgi:hypothetical protein
VHNKSSRCASETAVKFTEEQGAAGEETHPPKISAVCTNAAARASMRTALTTARIKRKSAAARRRDWTHQSSQQTRQTLNNERRTTTQPTTGNERQRACVRLESKHRHNTDIENEPHESGAGR